MRIGRILRSTFLLACGLGTGALPVRAAEVFIRFRLTEPSGERFRVRVGGHCHHGPNWFPSGKSAEVKGDAWSDWIDLRDWPLHERAQRVGGLAEWPSLKLSVSRLSEGEEIAGCAFEVQLADAPAEDKVVISFSERSASETIGFLVPHPLRERAGEFETGSQMTDRHLAWAREIAGSQPRTLKRFDVCTTLWGHYDPALAAKAVETLKLLGFNVVNGADPSVLRAAGVRMLGKSWHYMADPEESVRQWKEYAEGKLARRLASEEGRWEYSHMPHLVIADEVKTLSFQGIDKARLDGWFREYLKERGVTDSEVGTPQTQIAYPLEELSARSLPRNANVQTRRLLYHAAKFGHYWSARQLRQTSDLIRSALPGMKTETLPASHGFFNAWGPPHLGMSYPLLDLFELGEQQSVDVLSSEDWLGLNHMYGPGNTWTGAQSFAYLNAILRSAIGDRPMKLLGLITPSDDRYLRLKAYSSLAQGAKAFYFWTFGPTYIGTENYWSDLRSEYEGIAATTRALHQAEDVLMDARPVTDPVAILYSVSQDIWYPDQPAAFVEKRLLWHALRHLGVQPDFMREEDIAAGKLEKYRLLYVVDPCVSRKASAAIDRWVRAGGVVYLSAGACTRDEVAEPYVPDFAREVWPENAAAVLEQDPEPHRFNERVDLPEAKPLSSVRVAVTSNPFKLPVLGWRQRLSANDVASIATFEDGAPAGRLVQHGRGQVMGVGFLPMLAYGHGAGFQPRTLEEKWPMEPREIIRHALDRAGVVPVARASEPVVETGLLAGPRTSALVLVNYTYKPLGTLTVDLNWPAAIRRAVSCEGVSVQIESLPGGTRITLPLEWTDIVLLEHE
ncbi:MAG: hypothetical protein AMXMBFR13_35380 [Phycisphaerae bacterium]